MGDVNGYGFDDKRTITKMEAHTIEDEQFVDQFSSYENIQGKGENMLNSGNLNLNEKLYDNLKKFTCDQCSYSSVQRTHVEKHAKSVHSRIHDFVCSDCEYSTANRSNLTRHTTTKHQ